MGLIFVEENYNIPPVQPSIQTPTPVTPEQPISMSSSSGSGTSVIGSPDEKIDLKFRVYCNKEDGCFDVNVENISCHTTSLINDLEFGPSKNIDFGSADELNAVFSIRDNVNVGLYLCSVSFANLEHKIDFTLDVID